MTCRCASIVSTAPAERWLSGELEADAPWQSLFRVTAVLALQTLDILVTNQSCQ